MKGKCKAKVPLFSGVTKRTIKIGTKGDILGSRFLKNESYIDSITNEKVFIPDDECRMYLVKFNGFSCPKSVKESEIYIF
jgi:hypothetical protein